MPSTNQLLTTIDPQPVKVREGWLTISAQPTWMVTWDAETTFADVSNVRASSV